MTEEPVLSRTARNCSPTACFYVDTQCAGRCPLSRGWWGCSRLKYPRVGVRGGCGPCRPKQGLGEAPAQVSARLRFRFRSRGLARVTRRVCGFLRNSPCSPRRSDRLPSPAAMREGPLPHLPAVGAGHGPPPTSRPLRGCGVPGGSVCIVPRTVALASFTWPFAVWAPALVTAPKSFA